MGRIQKLPDHVINQIKAGEVVDRPISIVKELVENAIDAGGIHIVVELIDGGKQLIRVADDGHGMDADDLRNCLERHATSKLKQLSDLDSISSLGFRGEALPSIASVCRFSIRSKQQNSGVGCEIEVENGVASAVQQVAMPQGTVVTVRDLFSNVPARQKFLKATATEFSHIHDYLFASALAYPHVGFKLTHNGREVFSWKPHKNRDTRFQAVFGAEAQEYARVEYSRGSFQVAGYAGLPEFAKPAARQFITFVNGRLVRDRVIRAGVLQAYNGLILKGMVPSAVVFVQVDPSWIDVNVHPSKTELRFRDAAAIQDLISIAVQDNIKANLATSSSPMAVTPNSNIMYAQTPARSHDAPAQSQISSLAHASTHISSAQKFQSPMRAEGARYPHVAALSTSRSVQSTQEANELVVQECAQPVLFESAKGPFSCATYIGQFKNCYLLLECAGELWVLDQHAFHERILFEELTLSARQEGRVPQQELITPVLVPIPSSIIGVVVSFEKEWRSLGFRLEALANSSIAIHAFPTIISASRIVPVFEDIVTRMMALSGVGTSEVHPLISKARELQPQIKELAACSSDLSSEGVYHLFYATMACHSAVRAGEALSPELVRRLLLRANDVDFYAHCPHGRPVWRKFTSNDVDIWFARV